MNASDIGAAKASLVARGEDLSGPCGALKIIKAAAGANAPAGLLRKPSGNNCDGFAVDIVCFPDGHIFDGLIDAGGLNEPSWQDKGFVDPALYAPVTPLTVPEPPTVPKPADPPTAEPSGPSLEDLVAKIAAKVVELLPEPKAPVYEGSIFGYKLVLTPRKG